MRRLSAAVFVALLGPLCACTMTRTLPVIVITPKGEILRGTTTASAAGGSFQVTNGLLTCAGNYDALNPSVTITMTVLCSDGRKGIVIATREASGMAGHGKVRLNDGSEADFIFGQAAENF